MNPNYLLMALAGLSRDPNAGMNALKGFTVADELARRDEEKQASAQAAAAALEMLKQGQINRDTETGFQNRSAEISKMPEQTVVGPNTSSLDVSGFAPVGMPNVSDVTAPNPERQSQEQQLASDIQKYKAARIHPADTLISVLKNNPNVPADTAAKYVGLVYALQEKEQDAMNRMGQILLQHKLDINRDYLKEKAKADLRPEKTELKTVGAGGGIWNPVTKQWEVERPAIPTKDADQAKREGFEALYPNMKGKIGTPEYANAFRDYTNKTAEKLQVSVEGAYARGKAYADERFYPMFDTKTGQTYRVKGVALNNDANGRYLDPSDPTLASDKQSLVKVTKGMDSVGAFEKGAAQALDFAQSVAKDYGLGKFPGVNTVSQLFEYQAGNPKVKGLRNAITTAATEYMKVINAGSDLTAAELSVMGQNRAKEIIQAADNFDSLKNSISIMKREMQISGDKFRAQRKEIQSRIGGGYKNNSIPEPSVTETPKSTGSRFKILEVK